MNHIDRLLDDNWLIDRNWESYNSEGTEMAYLKLVLIEKIFEKDTKISIEKFKIAKLKKDVKKMEKPSGKFVKLSTLEKFHESLRRKNINVLFKEWMKKFPKDQVKTAPIKDDIKKINKVSK